MTVVTRRFRSLTLIVSVKGMFHHLGMSVSRFLYSKSGRLSFALPMRGCGVEVVANA